MRIALNQLEMRWEDKTANLATAKAAVKAAAARGCDIIAFPEMTLTGFSMNTDATAEPPGGPSERAFAELAAENGVAILAGLVERTERGCANLAVFFDSEGSIAAKYVKSRLFPLAGEPERHIPGDGPKPFPVAGTPAAALICYDLRFPELFRAVAEDVRIFFVIANWPAARSDHWKTLLKARAIENQCFVAGVNRTGTAPDGTEHSGDSAIFAPDGAQTPRLDIDGPNLVFEIDPDAVDAHRRRYPFLR